jgi:hypothetical protein
MNVHLQFKELNQIILVLVTIDTTIQEYQRVHNVMFRVSLVVIRQIMAV